MSERNHWLDGVIRDQGTYRTVSINDDDEGTVVIKSPCIANDMEDALIEALDAGMTAEEIADIQLGAIS
ncbi:MAG: hypothetical protein ACFFCW_38475 [Candidatus Hodarchaeota archaeon]